MSNLARLVLAAVIATALGTGCSKTLPTTPGNGISTGNLLSGAATSRYASPRNTAEQVGRFRLRLLLNARDEPRGLPRPVGNAQLHPRPPHPTARTHSMLPMRPASNHRLVELEPEGSQVMRQAWYSLQKFAQSRYRKLGHTPCKFQPCVRCCYPLVDNEFRYCTIALTRVRDISLRGRIYPSVLGVSSAPRPRFQSGLQRTHHRAQAPTSRAVGRPGHQLNPAARSVGRTLVPI